jgi:pimeloyl-ACP methyl ester carboxylesterase
MWEPQRPALEGFRVATPRLYGRGSSIAEWGAQILREVEGPIVVVGASMGGYTALAMARQEAERVRALVLAGSRARTDEPERAALRNETIRVLREEGAGAWLEGAPAEAPSSLTTDELVAATEALRDRRDASDVVASFAGPLLVVVGDGDELVSADEARSLAASAPNGRCEVVAGAGHIVSLDQPERFNELLGGFLAPWR